MNSPLVFMAKTISMSKRCGRKPCSLLNAARHNLREIQAELGSRGRIDPMLSRENKILIGPAQAVGVVEMAKKLIEQYRVPACKLRVDHVQAVEFVVSAPPRRDFDTEDFFLATSSWLVGRFGRDKVLSVVVHSDEGRPHLHALVSPIVDGCYVGGSLIGKTRLPLLIGQFAAEVGSAFGLSFTRRPVLPSAQRRAALDLILDRLRLSSDPVIASLVWPQVQDHIERDPQPYLEVLGLLLPDVRSAVKRKSFTQIMTGIGRRTVEDRRCRSAADPSCVGVRSRNSAKPASGGQP